MTEIDTSSVGLPPEVASDSDWIYVGAFGAVQHVDPMFPRWSVIEVVHCYGNWELVHCDEDVSRCIYTEAQPGIVVVVDVHRPHSLVQKGKFFRRGVWIAVTKSFKSRKAAKDYAKARVEAPALAETYSVT